MRLDKIYTKVGDKGKTMLASGTRIPKSDIRIHAYGTVDELNSVVALLRDFLEETQAIKGEQGFSETLEYISKIQNELFDVGGELSTPNEILDPNKQQVVTSESIKRLETEIDAMNKDLAPLTNFVLPGGHRCVSQAHVCRCVCRRAERLVCELSEAETIRKEPLIYLNRLSDWLFVLSRSIAQALKIEEILWLQNNK